MRRVPAAQASMEMEHVADCLCHSFALKNAKMIDARCIAAYLVPEDLVLCYGMDVPHQKGLHPDQCEGCA